MKKPRFLTQRTQRKLLPTTEDTEAECFDAVATWRLTQKSTDPNANQVSQFGVRVWVCRFLSEPACRRPAGASKRTHFIRALLKHARSAAPESSATSVFEIFAFATFALKRDFFTLSEN